MSWNKGTIFRTIKKSIPFISWVTSSKQISHFQNIIPKYSNHGLRPFKYNNIRDLFDGTKDKEKGGKIMVKKCFVPLLHAELRNIYIRTRVRQCDNNSSPGKTSVRGRSGWSNN